MPLYKITYRKPDRSQTFAFSEGADESAAIRALNINRSLVVSAKRDWMEELDRKLPKSSPPIDIQARVISIFAAKVASGLNPSTTFNRTVASVPMFEKQLGDLERFPKVSEKMKLLRFDPQLQLLAAVGESSGLVAETLGNAADQLIERNRILGEIKKQVLPSMLIALLGVLTLLVLPLFMVEPIESVRDARGIVLKTNVSTDILLFLGHLFDSIWAWLILGGSIAAVSLTASKWWPAVRTLPGFATVEAFLSMQNAYRFVSAFVPLFSRGVHMTQSVEMLMQYGSKSTQAVYGRMLEHLRSGGSISAAFEDPHWDPLLRDLMKGFDDMKQESKIDLLTRMQPLMAQTMGRMGQKLGAFMTAFGLITSVVATLIVFHGLTIPLMSVGTSMGSGG